LIARSLALSAGCDRLSLDRLPVAGRIFEGREARGVARSPPHAPPADRGDHRRGSDQSAEEKGAQPLCAALVAVHGSIIRDRGRLIVKQANFDLAEYAVSVDDFWAGYVPDRHRPPSELSDSGSERKGWGRASIKLNTKPDRLPTPIDQADLLIPTSADRLLLLGACLVCGACISVLWGYFPLFLLSVVTGVTFGGWLWGSLVAVALGSALLLFAIAVERERGYAETLY
jgi:hypothetical protein